MLGEHKRTEFLDLMLLGQLAIVLLSTLTPRAESKKHRNNVKFFTYPSDKILRSKKIEITHWSSYENWDPYRNYITAKKFCGLQESLSNNLGTFTNFAHNDQALSALHYYLMYIKFGFGRATQDAGIEIRRGAMSREQAKNLVNLYDGQYPKKHLPLYLEGH